jgi:hypothetical protein
MFAGAVKSTAVGSGPALNTRPSALHVCRYSKTSPGAEVGNFVSGGTVTGAVEDRVLSQLDGAPLAKFCLNRARTFLLLEPTAINRGDAAIIELDGCLRMIRENRQIVQLTPAQVATVIAALPR